MATNIMIVAGEASGDLHGANLARKLSELEPGVCLSGMGGALMQQAGVHLLHDPTRLSVMGVVEVLRHVRVLRRIQAQMIAALERQKPDVVVLIDYPGFNMRLAQEAHSRGMPAVYYISPSAWAWKRGRAKRVARTTACVCAIFPFEAEVYRAAGAAVCYVGHPLLDIVHSTAERRCFLPEIGLQPDRPFFALLPGSRQQEIRLLLPDMLQAAELIRAEVPEAQFALPVAHTLRRDLIDSYLAAHSGLAVAVVAGRTHDIMATADAAIIASGTATLEAAILGTPMVMVYKLAPLTYRILKRLVKIKLFALPNIVAGRKVVEELIQMDATPERMAAEVLALWRQPERRATMAAGFAEMVQRLGQTGAVTRTAQAVLAVAHRADPQQFAVEG